MRRLNSDEVKNIQIQIYKHVADFCEQNNISYWIDCGSLIGTIRHKGFIPWDDDIDIGMLRPDFIKMINLFNDKNERYRFSCIENDENSFTAYGKVLDTNTVMFEPDENGYKSCISVDIFVYDNAPDDNKRLERMYRRRNFYQLLGGFQHNGFSDHGLWYKKMILSMLYKLTNIVPENYFLMKIAKNAQACMNEKTRRVGNFTSSSMMSCDKRVFNSFITKEFEGFSVRVPVGYDEWLRAFYGNYMELPPVEKRVSHHSFKAYKL